MEIERTRGKTGAMVHKRARVHQGAGGGDHSHRSIKKKKAGKLRGVAKKGKGKKEGKGKEKKCAKSKAGVLGEKT